MHRDAIERPAHRGPIGHVAFDLERRAAELFRRSLNGLGMDVEQRHFGARPAQRARRRKADRTRTAGDDRDLSGQRLIDALAELGLFQRPVFDVEQVSLADRFEPVYCLGIGDCLDVGFGDVGGDAGLAKTRAHDADDGRRKHSRQIAHPDPEHDEHQGPTTAQAVTTMVYTQAPRRTNALAVVAHEET